MNRMYKILWFLVIISMTSIFILSAQEAETSNQLSTGVTQKLVQITIPHYTELSAAEQIDIVKRLNGWMRKSAHFFNFQILGFLLAWLCKAYYFLAKKRVVATLLAGLLYAISDEIHQFFVLGRGAQLKDVCIDFAGILMGLLIFEVFLKFLEIRTNIRSGRR